MRADAKGDGAQVALGCKFDLDNSAPISAFSLVTVGPWIRRVILSQRLLRNFGRAQIYALRKKSATRTSNTFASLIIVVSEGLRLPRMICERCPFENSVSK